MVPNVSCNPLASAAEMNAAPLLNESTLELTAAAADIDKLLSVSRVSALEYAILRANDVPRPSGMRTVAVIATVWPITTPSGWVLLPSGINWIPAVNDGLATWMLG